MAHSTATNEATTAFLHAHGIQVVPENLGAMLQEAVSRLRRTLYRGDSRNDLPPQEAAALERAGFDLSPRDLGEADPLALGAAEFAAMLATSLTTSQAARRLGVASSRIRQRLTASHPTLYGIRLDSGWRIPIFQFEEGGLLPGLGRVVSALSTELHPVAVYRWFTTPNPDLWPGDLADGPLCPRDWLRLGRAPDAVVELARQV